MLVTWEEFIAMWYRNMDKNRIIPLYLLHQKRFYDWFGNKSLQATVDMMANKPKEKWRYVLKKMCKMGVIDHEYIHRTCDMSWVTEEYLMDETERYIQRYDSQKMMNTNANTNAISSLDWSNRFSVSHTMTQQLEEEFKKLKDQIRMREEMKKFQEEQATFLLAQLLKFEEQCKLFEEERTQLTVEKARLFEEQKAIQEQN